MESYVVDINTINQNPSSSSFKKHEIKPRPKRISQLVFDQQYQSVEYEMKKWLSEVDWGSVKSMVRSLSFYFGHLNAELEMFT